MKSGDKNNWNMSSDQFVNFASSLSSFLAQSIKLQKTGNEPNLNQSNNYEANVKHIKSELTSFNDNKNMNSNNDNNEVSVNINLNDSQLKLPIEIINSLCNSSLNNTSNQKVSLKY